MSLFYFGTILRDSNEVQACFAVEVPTGYMSDAKTVQEDTLLPLPGSSEFDDDAPNATRYVEILGGFRKFVETVSN